MKFSNAYRSSVLALSVISMLGAALPVEARVGSSSSGSRASAPARAAAPASRVGGGGSTGMQRPSVMNSVRANPAPMRAPAPVAPRPAMAAVPSAPMAPAQAAAKKDRSWVAPAAIGALAGAAATYALTDRNHQAAPQYQAQQPQYQAQPQPYQAPQYQAQPQPYQAPQYQAQPQPYPQQVAPVQVAPPVPAVVPQAVQPQSSSGFGFGGFLLMLGLLGLGVFLYKKMTGSSRDSSSLGQAPRGVPASHVASGGSDDEVMARRFFTELQDLNNQGNLAALRKKTTSDIYGMLAHDIQTRTEGSNTAVVSLNVKILSKDLENDQQVMSVRFTGLVSESANRAPDSIDEVWHFVQEPSESEWRLAGIEQV